MTTEEILAKEGVKHYDKPIQKMTTNELKANFSTASSGKIVVSKVIKNIIWQAYEWIQAGGKQIDGNLRSFWYIYVKSVMGKIGALDDATDPCDEMTDLFTEFTQDHKLFKYREFGFDDENWENRRIGEKWPNIIIFGEKTGYMKLLREFYETYGVTIAALGGQPSSLSTEYTVTHIGERISLTTPFFLLSIVDYDPSGAIITKTYLEQLRCQRVAIAELVNLISLENFTPEEIETYKFPLPTSKWATTINEKWLEETGGIQGELYGMEADSMPRDRIRELVKKEIARITSKL